MPLSTGHSRYLFRSLSRPVSHCKLIRTVKYSTASNSHDHASSGSPNSRAHRRRVSYPFYVVLATTLAGSYYYYYYYYYDSYYSNSGDRKKANGTPPSPPTQPTLTPPTREEMITRLKRSNLETQGDSESDVFDLLIVGGGATGAGVALDAASRGLKVALIERSDFSSGTSSKSTKLVHGGVRYLQKAVLELDPAQYALVKEALHERSVFLHSTAPYLSKMLPIALPVYTYWQIPYYYVGCKMYDFLAGGLPGLLGSKLDYSDELGGGGENEVVWHDTRYPSAYLMSPKRTLQKFPNLRSEGLRGAVVYYDGQHNDSRMNIVLVLTAVEHGAVAANYVQLVEFLKNQNGEETGRIKGAILKDVLTGEEFSVKAKGVINATGPYADTLLTLDELSSSSSSMSKLKGIKRPSIVPSSGVHISLPTEVLTGSPSISSTSASQEEEMGLLDASSSDGRVVFILPWLGSVIAGTTDVGCEIQNRARLVSSGSDDGRSTLNNNNGDNTSLKARVVDPIPKNVISRTPNENGTGTGLWKPINPSWIEEGEIPKEDDIQWVLSEVKRYLKPEAAERLVKREDVKSVWAGVRPLVSMTSSSSSPAPAPAMMPSSSSSESEEGGGVRSVGVVGGKGNKKETKTEGLVRNHVVYVHPESGLLTIVGGKWTTYRKMAEDAVDEAVKVFKLGKGGNEEQGQGGMNCVTPRIPLVGTRGWNPNLWKSLTEIGGVEESVARYLAESYGARAWDVLRCAENWDSYRTKRSPSSSTLGDIDWKLLSQERLHPLYPQLVAEVRYAVRHEYARTAGDVLERRTRLAYIDEHAAKDVWEQVEKVVNEELAVQERANGKNGWWSSSWFWGLSGGLLSWNLVDGYDGREGVGK